MDVQFFVTSTKTVVLCWEWVWEAGLLSFLHTMAAVPSFSPTPSFMGGYNASAVSRLELHFTCTPFLPFPFSKKFCSLPLCNIGLGRGLANTDIRSKSDPQVFSISFSFIFFIETWSQRSGCILRTLVTLGGTNMHSWELFPLLWLNLITLGLLASARRKSFVIT